MTPTKPLELVPLAPESMPVARPVDPEDPVGLFKLAIESKAGADTLERVMAVRRELRAEHAKFLSDQAMSSLQSRCPIIAKKKAGAKNAYRYAPLDDIVLQVRDLIREHGFSFTITSEIEAGWVKAVVTITHAGGHSFTSEFKVPIDTKNPMQTEPQRYGGAITFAKRYAFCNGFGILTADEDLDGGSKPKPPGPSTLAAEPDVKTLAQELWTLLKPVRGTEKNWNAANQWLWRQELLDGAADEAAPALSPARFAQVLAACRAHPELKP